jgi:hypothetical protein
MLGVHGFVKDTNSLDQWNGHLLFEEGLVSWSSYNAMATKVCKSLGGIAVFQFAKNWSRKITADFWRNKYGTRTDLMDRSPSWEANSRSTTQISLLLCNTQVYYFEHNDPELDPMPEPNESSPHPQRHSLRFILILSYHVQIRLPSNHFPSGFLTTILSQEFSVPSWPTCCSS